MDIVVEFNQAMELAIIFSGIFLWVGMLTGVWKYYQIRRSQQSRAHYYVDIAHRSSLLYASASLILACLSSMGMGCKKSIDKAKLYIDRIKDKGVILNAVLIMH